MVMMLLRLVEFSIVTTMVAIPIVLIGMMLVGIDAQQHRDDEP